MIQEYKKEFSRLKPHDPIQMVTNTTDGQFVFLITAGHGYLVVPMEHPKSDEAIKICSYGYVGDKAIYLEEDCEAGEFINSIK